MTQKDLALRLGITPQQVQKAEKGKNRISASRLLRISLIPNEPIVILLKEACQKLSGCSDGTLNPKGIKPDDWQLARLIAEIDDP